jgi:trehalose 6-phosphate synthase/phosphatase
LLSPQSVHVRFASEEFLRVTIATVLTTGAVDLSLVLNHQPHAMSDTEKESPERVPEGQPDPVLVGPGLTALKWDAYQHATNATPSLETDKNFQMDSDAPSYFANIPGVRTESLNPSDSASASHNTGMKTSSGQELLRRLSLAGDASPMSPEVDPRAQHPGLNLSGRLISAAFCIPYKLYFQSGSDWVCGAFLLSNAF